jgi:hypothetical protein
MIKASLEHISQNKSIVFDATNSSLKKDKNILNLLKNIIIKSHAFMFQHLWKFRINAISYEIMKIMSQK